MDLEIKFKKNREKNKSKNDLFFAIDFFEFLLPVGPIWKGLGVQVGAKLGQVGPKIAILASFGCSWAPLGRILVPKRSQNGSQGTPRRLQEWIFGRFLVDFNAYIAYIYQQKSRYERHLTSTCVLLE